MTLPLNTIIHGLCLDVLKTFPDACIDGGVTDPPYGLGAHDPTLPEILAYLNGEGLKTGEFMGKDWQIPSIPTWKEVFRVLKPGAFLFVFAGSRTQDLMSLGLRAAGFENRDMFPVEYGPAILRWVRAQGMPKSTDIPKEIDRKLNVTRTNPKLPESPEAKHWEGYGTAFKPYWEPILVFRKPVEEATVAEQVLKTGTGALNIKASRIKHASKADFDAHKAGVDALKAKGGSMGKSWKNSSDLSGANDVEAAGRFPANVILVHAGECKVERKDGFETWSCIPECPIEMMNSQRGKSVSKPDTRQGGKLDTREQGWRFKRQPSNLSDSGGPARYFLNLDPDPGFQYIPKPSQKEKNDGLEEEEENEHVTVKPIALMRYLVRLCVPKGALVLDLYCGSGTTCVAAAELGCDFIGIEKELPSVETARQRVALVMNFREQQSRATSLLESLDDG